MNPDIKENLKISEEFLEVARKFVNEPDIEFVNLIYSRTVGQGRCVMRSILSLLSESAKLNLETAKKLASWLSFANPNSELAIMDLLLELGDKNKLGGKNLYKYLNSKESSIYEIEKYLGRNMQVCILLNIYNENLGIYEQHLAHIESIQIDENGLVTHLISRSDRRVVQLKIQQALNNIVSFSTFVIA